MISIPPGALCLLVDILTQLGQDRGVAVLPEKVEFITQEAADDLNVSRPYLEGWNPPPYRGGRLQDSPCSAR
jgi:hypothetical protein